MNPDQFTVVKVASRNYNVLDESGSPLTDPEGNVLRFMSAGAARAEIEASKTDAEEDTAASVAGEAPVDPAAACAYVAAMSRTERVLAAKAENVALVAWREAGEDPAAKPATPVLDALGDPSLPKPAKAGKAPAGPKAPDPALVGIVREAFTAEKFGVSRLYGVARAAGVKASKSTMTAAVELVRAEMGLAS